jgi:hypothetical protein
MTSRASATRAPGCVSDLDLDELLSGDLVGLPRASALRAHIDGCTRCRERLSAFEAVEPPPAGVILSRVKEAGTRPPRTSRWPFALVVMTMGAAVAAAFVVVVRPSPGPGVGADERTKGGLALTVFVKRAGGAVETVTRDGTLRPGDEMRFSLATGRPGYAVVLGLDAAPSVTLYAPYAPTAGAAQAIKLDSAGKTALPGSIVADETGGAERVVAVVCEGATPPEALRARAVAALTAAAGDPARVSSLGTGCLESGVLLHKEPRAR